MSRTSQRCIAVRICEGNSTDLDAVMKVMTNSFDAAYGEGWSRSQCAGILPLSGVTLVLACDDQQQVHGFSLQRTISGESELLLLAVDRAAQRSGIGSRLLDHFIDASRAGGATRVHLEVRDGNPATAMYRAYGFKPVGHRANYYRGTNGGLFDAVTMALDID